MPRKPKPPTTFNYYTLPGEISQHDLDSAYDSLFQQAALLYGEKRQAGVPFWWSSGLLIGWPDYHRRPGQ